MDPLGLEFLLLLLELLHDLLFSPQLLLPFEFFLRDGFARTRLGVRVVGRTAGALLGVLLFAEFGTAVLEPYLKETS